MQDDYDVIVIGGGPGGSAVSTFVAMDNHRVLLLEEESFPRYQIGESLLPATVHGICGLLGVKDELDRQNFPLKYGGTFRWGRSPEPWTFSFSSVGSPTGTAYQVERSKFDHILLENARAKSVDVREGHRVQEAITRGGRTCGVRYVDKRGFPHIATARFVVDAGGNRSQVYKNIGDRIYSRFFQNIAIHGYYENAARLPYPNRGNILSVAFDQGWFWYIPLSDSLTSVGAVVSREFANVIQSGPETAMRSFIARAPMIAAFLSKAVRVRSGVYGVLRIRKDYSYCSTRFQKEGCVLVGDAACFIDPVFSSGVHLATYSALLAARSINTLLTSAGISEKACFEEFEMRYRREFGNFYQFLVGFYDMNADQDTYFWNARRIFGGTGAEDNSFVRLVAGLSALDEPLFYTEGKFVLNRIGFSEWFRDKLPISRNDSQPQVFSELKRTNAHVFDAFWNGFNLEIAQVQLQAFYGRDRPRERPLFAGGLVPSLDGLHWVNIER